MSSDKAAGGRVIQFININPPAHTEREILEELARRDPCALRGHRPAYRVDGGIECYDCGARCA